MPLNLSKWINRVTFIMQPKDRNKQVTKQEMQLSHTCSGKNMGHIRQLRLLLQIATNWLT